MTFEKQPTDWHSHILKALQTRTPPIAHAYVGRFRELVLSLGARTQADSNEFVVHEVLFTQGQSRDELRRLLLSPRPDWPVDLTSWWREMLEGFLRQIAGWGGANPCVCLAVCMHRPCSDGLLLNRADAKQIVVAIDAEASMTALLQAFSDTMDLEVRVPPIEPDATIERYRLFGITSFDEYWARL